jgi:uncharacterized protein YukE
MNDITAKADQLHGTSGQYQTVADQVSKIYQTLTAKLDAEGACWGNDTSGATFGKKYVPSALSVLSQMDNTNQGVQSMVDGICSWAKNYTNANASATADANQISSGAPTDNYSGVDSAVTRATTPSGG